MEIKEVLEMRMNQMPAGEKPREKLLRDGPEGLSTVEVLAVILGTRTRSKSVMDLAGDVLAMDARGLRYLAECSPEELKKISGMGDATVCVLMAALELGKRLSCLPAEERVPWQARAALLEASKLPERPVRPRRSSRSAV